RQVRWLNIACQEAVYDRLVACVACRILLEDPPAGVGAEGVHAAVVHDELGRYTNGRAAHGKLAHVAHHEKRFLMSMGDVSSADILGDRLPESAKSVTPTRVLGFQPLTLRLAHPCIRVPPDGASLEPNPQVKGMVEPVQLFNEKVPIPGMLQSEITELIAELLNNPFEHELFEGKTAMRKGRVVIHCRAGQEG